MHTSDDERTADMANPAAKYADEFRRETSGGPDPKAAARFAKRALERWRTEPPAKVPRT